MDPTLIMLYMYVISRVFAGCIILLGAVAVVVGIVNIYHRHKAKTQIVTRQDVNSVDFLSNL